MDETMLAVGTSNRAKVIVPREWKDAPALAPDSRNKHYTFIFCVSADGGHLPTCAVLPQLKFLPTDLNPIVDSLAWSASSSGWITDAIYEDWIQNVFLPFLESKRAIHNLQDATAVLWIDGHGSRSSEIAQERLKAKNVVQVVIPAHTSHIVAPLDCGVNRSFKNNLSKYYRHPASSSAPDVRSSLLTAAVRAQYHAFDPHIIRTAFSEPGVWPWRPEAILGDPAKVSDKDSRPPPRPSSRNISGRVLVTQELVTAHFAGSLPPEILAPCSNAV
jgi:hypothetical protein